MLIQLPEILSTFAYAAAPALFQSFDLLGVILILVGIVAIIIEMFIPGFGVFGIAGIISLIAGIFIQAQSFIEALIIVVVVIAVLALIFWLFLRSAFAGRLRKSGLILTESTDKESGYIASEDLESYKGKHGYALTSLRPAGTGCFDDIRLDVVTEGEFIDKGANLIVTKVEGRRVVVLEVTEDE